MTIVGYGKKNGSDVWVVKNSWGEEWGDHGFFFVPIGRNSYCIEMIIFGIIANVQGDNVLPPLKTNRTEAWQLDQDDYNVTCKNNENGLIYVNEDTCVSRCPYGTFRVDAVTGEQMCVKECNESYWLQSDDQKKCVSECPIFHISQRCYSSCPDIAPFSSDNMECLSNCPQSQF